MPNFATTVTVDRAERCAVLSLECPRERAVCGAPTFTVTCFRDSSGYGWILVVTVLRFIFQTYVFRSLVEIVKHTRTLNELNYPNHYFLLFY